MCFGPVRVLWGDGNDTGERLDDKLVLLVGFDLIEINEQRPYIASPNEFDFYFLARKNISAKNAKLHFWFPFPTEPMPMVANKNDPKRRENYLNWQLGFLKQSIKVQNPYDVRSLGWNEEETRRILPPNNHEWGDIEATLNHYLDKAISSDFALTEPGAISFSYELIEHGDKTTGQHQLFTVTLNGDISEGDIFHIFYTSEEASANPDAEDPCRAQVPLYYYNEELPEIEFPWINHACRNAPIIPCALLHVALMFPLPAKVSGAYDYAKTLTIGTHTIKSPTNTKHLDWRWFIVCNAHQAGLDGEKFVTEWSLPGCQGKDEEAEILKILSERIRNMSSPKELLIQNLGDNERRYVEVALKNFDTLTGRQKECIELIGHSYNNDEIADKLGIESGSARNLTNGIWKRLKLTEVGDGTGIDKRALLAKVYSINKLS